MYFFGLIFSLYFFYSYSQYQANWSSLDTRPLPIWYDQAKFGILAHWGVFSVPEYSNEWFWFDWKYNNNTNITKFVSTHYKPATTYTDFAKKFTAYDFDANSFANIVKSSYAKYFIITAKHYDGYTLWPSSVHWNWNAKELGSSRDLLSEIRAAILSLGNVHFGAYISLVDWFNPLLLRDIKSQTQKYVNTILYPTLTDLVTNYQPDILWADGAYLTQTNFLPNSTFWRSQEFLAWLYNQSPVKSTIITNDRWGYDTNCAHGGFYTCQNNPTTLPPYKWENLVGLDKYSFGARRSMTVDDVVGLNDLIVQFVKTISLGGNFLLNIAPDANGRVLPIFEERLNDLGNFVNDHSEAIFGSKPWIYQSDGNGIWYTSQLRDSSKADPYRLINSQSQNNTIIYAFVTNWPINNLINLTHVTPTAQTIVNVLGHQANAYDNVPYTQSGNGILVDISVVPITNFPSSNYVLFETFVVKIEYAADQCPPNWVKSATNAQECLLIISNVTDWNSAKIQCGQKGGYLVSVDNAFENREVDGLLGTCSHAWIGLYKNGTNWAWANGDPSTYSNWETGYPSADPNNVCVAMVQNDAKWVNQACDIQTCFICKLIN